MFAALRTPRNPLLICVGLVAALLVAACQPVPGTGNGPNVEAGTAVPVALLVPAGSGNTGDETLAASLKQAAQLAISDLNGVKIDLRVYNTGAGPEQAAAMATKAVDEGAKIILGPVFAESANAAGLAVASRGVSVLRNTTLIVNLPGSKKAVEEALEIVLPTLEHGIRLAKGTDGECGRT